MLLFLRDLQTEKMLPLHFNTTSRQNVMHKDAVDIVVTIPSTPKDVGELLSREYAKEKEINRRMFVKIVTSIKYLASQGISLWGDGDEEDGNFMQLLRLRADDDPDLVAWLQHKQNKYTSQEIQNEILKTMAISVLRNIASCLQSSPFLTLMMDETTDVSNTSQHKLLLFFAGCQICLKCMKSS